MKKQIKQIFNPLSGSFDSIQVTDATKDTDLLLQLTADESLSDWTFLNDDLSISKVNPLFGDASYELGMTNLAAATYKVMPVDIGFRGTTVALTLNYLMPQGASRVELLDQDNNLIDGTTFDIPAANGKEKFGTTVFIPSSVTGIRFKAESRATVAGQVFKFDNVQLSADLLKSVDVGDKIQSETLLNVGALTITSNLASYPTEKSKGGGLYRKSAAGIEILQPCSIKVSYTMRSDGSSGNYTATQIRLNSNSRVYTTSDRSGATGSSAYFSGDLETGDIITFIGEGNVIQAPNTNVFISATARTKSIVAPTDQVTERSIAFRWRSPAEATEANLSATGQIGDFVTGQYAINTNTLTQCTTRPTQTDADMSVEGVKIFTRAYNAASTAALPARFVIKIAEPNQMAACDLTLYKDITKTLTGAMDLQNNTGSEKIGLSFKEFNPRTGLLLIDAGYTWAGTFTGGASLTFSDRSLQNNGYLTFTASKLAQGVAIPTPARYVVKTYQSGTSWYEVYNDGWVRQGGVGNTGTSSSGVTIPFLVPFRDSSYLGYTNYDVRDGGAPSAAVRTLGPHGQTTTKFNVSGMSGTTYVAYVFVWMKEGYGDSAAVKALGATPNY